MTYTFTASNPGTYVYESGTDTGKQVQMGLYGALIVVFLVREPLGLAKVYDNIRNYFLVWPFRHARR